MIWSLERIGSTNHPGEPWGGKLSRPFGKTADPEMVMTLGVCFQGRVQGREKKSTAQNVEERG